MKGEVQYHRRASLEAMADTADRIRSVTREEVAAAVSKVENQIRQTDIQLDRLQSGEIIEKWMAAIDSVRAIDFRRSEMREPGLRAGIVSPVKKNYVKSKLLDAGFNEEDSSLLANSLLRLTPAALDLLKVWKVISPEQVEAIKVYQDSDSTHGTILLKQTVRWCNPFGTSCGSMIRFSCNMGMAKRRSVEN